MVTYITSSTGWLLVQEQKEMTRPHWSFIGQRECDGINTQGYDDGIRKSQ